jgi:hypothetical protein
LAIGTRLANCKGMRLVGVAALLLLASNVAAEHAGTPALRANVHGGVGTPLGYVGVTAEALPFAWLSLEAGAGKGFFGDWFQDRSTRWLNKSAHASVRWVLGTGAVVTVGGGISIGPFGEGDTLPLPGHGCDSDCTGTRYQAVWLNADGAIEWRLDSGHAARAYIGVARMDRGGPDLERTNWPYVGLAFTLGELVL